LRTLQSATLAPAAAAILKALSYLLPNFENFNVMAAVAHGRGVPGELVLHDTLYAILYCAIALAAASAVFSRRNLK
jgi:ABC-type transport system involved in multi-copper enzyme maturation permease subunit